MSNPYVGQLQAFGFGIIPRGWAPCNGQLLPIAQNQALFALLGTQFGGDGIRTFALPNLQGNLMLCAGNGGGGNYVPGQQGGSATVSLTTAQIPAHMHPALGSSTTAVPLAPNGAFPAKTTAGSYSASSNTTLGPGSSPAGGNQPHPNQAPYLAINICIALTGIFPSRN